MTPVAALILAALAGAPPSTPAPRADAVANATAPGAARGCALDDVVCLRRAYAAAGGQGIPGDCPGGRSPGAAPEGVSVKDAAALGPSVPCVQDAGTGTALPWWATAAAQWGVTLGADLLPAVLFALAAVVLVLPAGSVPALVLLGLALAGVSGLPLVQATGTNLVGDAMSRGEKRGRLVFQVALAVGMLALQVGVAAVALVAVGAIVNVVAVQLAAPEARHLPFQCGDPVAAPGRCMAQVQEASAAATPAFLVGALGMLGVVGMNLFIAVGVKGPLLALAWWLHATHPWAAPWPRFLPRLASTSPRAPADERERAVALAAAATRPRG